MQIKSNLPKKNNIFLKLNYIATNNYRVNILNIAMMVI